MFCLRKGVKSQKDKEHGATGNGKSVEQNLADSNASFLRAARAGNLDKVLEFLKGNIDINTSNANGLNALHLAAKEGHVNVVTELLKKGANVNAATKKGNTALHIASLAGQEEVVKVLANLGANVNVQSQNGFTPLYMAAQENHDNVVSFLLANGANQSLATEDGFTPLAVALQQGHDKVVAVLLENDTKGRVRLPALHIAAKKDDCKAATLLLQNDHNPDVTSKSGFTPLHIAAHYGNSKIANILLNKGADVNYAAKHQITPLHVASKWGKSNMVELLIAQGAKIEAVTRDGLTPLHCAARSGHDQVVDLLLEKGAPILAKTKNGLAPLHMSSQGDHVDSARILLYHKAPVDDVTVDYLTALHVAAHCGHVKVAKLLLDRKADSNARALNGFTPLHIACKKNRIKVVELLLKHGASIEATTESGLSPLHVASFMGCMNVVIYLIQSGANPDVCTVRGETPLHLAARANQIDIIRILLRNGANVDARAREEQTPLHIAARLGNVDIVSLLLQHGAAVDAITKDMYTALHIASKEGQEEVVSVLLDHEASLTAVTKRGFTPLHLAAKYGNIKVVRLLLQKDSPVDAQGKNGLTPLHVAAHYNHVSEALLLLEKGASPHAIAKNGFTPLHIAAKKNQMDIATTLLEYGATCNAESKAGYTPLHLSSQEGHTDMTTLLIEHQANVNKKAANGLTPLHLCAQEDRVNVAAILVKSGSEISPQTLAGYTPLHVASHFGQVNMVRFLLQNNAIIHSTTEHGYTPLHQAAQQGHTPVVNVLLENKASPNTTTLNGQTALSIAQKLGYISVVETLKVVTETTVTTTTTTVTEEKYKVVAPEIMQETFMTDSEDEGGEDTMLGDQSYRYLTADEMKSLGDDSLPIDVTKDEKQHEAIHMIKDSTAPMVEEDKISPQHITPIELEFSEKFSPDNIDISRAPVHAGFLVSFMVDARGGAMRGCRHSGVRVIIPPRKASMPMRITCRYLRKEKLTHPPPLMEGEACASRILEVGPVGARFLGPVILEIPHFASLRGREREVTILRSDTGETWREHSLEASEEAVQDVLNESFEGDEISALEDLNTNRITRILTTDFPQYFAIVTRIRQEVHGVGPEGGIVSSKVVPQVQAIFPEGALQKKIRVGLQAQPLSPELVAKLLGNRVAVSPIVTVEPRRRKFHKPITLTIPVPQAATKGMINQYSGDAPTLRLLCSITGSTKSGGSSKAQWEDVTGSTPLTFVNDCVSFTTTVSARFWLMDCRQVNEVSKLATELYQEAVHVPFMAKFVIFAKRHDHNEAQLRVFCMTDDKEDKTLETQEHFTEIAKSRDVEVLEGKLQHLEFAGNLVPVTNSKEQLKFVFHAFHENRLPFIIRVKDPHVEPLGRIAFMRETKVGRGEPPQTPICNLNIAMPEMFLLEQVPAILELVTLERTHDFMQEAGLSKPESIHRANLRLSDIARELDKDWVVLANELRVSDVDINVIKSRFPDNEQALEMLRIWLRRSGSKLSGNDLERALVKINSKHIINKCMFNVELVTDDVEKAVAKVHLDQSGFDVFKEELGSSREASMRRGASLDISYDEQDIMKEAESAAETSSETGSLFEKDQISQYLPEDKEVIQSSEDYTKEQNALIEPQLNMPMDQSIPTTNIAVIDDDPKVLERNIVEDRDENHAEDPSVLMKSQSPETMDQSISTTNISVKEDDVKVLERNIVEYRHEKQAEDSSVLMKSQSPETMSQNFCTTNIDNKDDDDLKVVQKSNDKENIEVYIQEENQNQLNMSELNICPYEEIFEHGTINQPSNLQEIAGKTEGIDTIYSYISEKNFKEIDSDILFEREGNTFDSSSSNMQKENLPVFSITEKCIEEAESDKSIHGENKNKKAESITTSSNDNETASTPNIFQIAPANEFDINCDKKLQSYLNDYQIQTHEPKITEIQPAEHYIEDVMILTDNSCLEPEISRLSLDENFVSHAGDTTCSNVNFEVKLGSKVMYEENSINQYSTCNKFENTCPQKDAPSLEFDPCTNNNSEDFVQIPEHTKELESNMAFQIAEKSDLASKHALSLRLDETADETNPTECKISSSGNNKEGLDQGDACKGRTLEALRNTDVGKDISDEFAGEVVLPESTVTEASCITLEANLEILESDFIPLAAESLNFSSIECPVNYSEDNHTTHSNRSIPPEEDTMNIKEECSKLFQEGGTKVNGGETEQCRACPNADEMDQYSLTEEESGRYGHGDKICRATKTPSPSLDKTTNQEWMDNDNIKKNNIEGITKEVEKRIELPKVSSVIIPTLPKMTESDIWPSDELNNGHILVSSLPYDDKSEPFSTTTTLNIRDEANREEIQKVEDKSRTNQSGTDKAIEKTILTTMSGQTESDASTEGNPVTSVIEQYANVHASEAPFHLKETVLVSQAKECDSANDLSGNQDVKMMLEKVSSNKNITIMSSEEHTVIRDISDECLEMSKVPESMTEKSTSLLLKTSQIREEQAKKNDDSSSEDPNLLSMPEDSELHEMIVSQNMDESLVDAAYADDADRWSTRTEGSNSDVEQELPFSESSKIYIYSEEMSCKKKVEDSDDKIDIESSIDVIGCSQICHLKNKIETLLVKDIRIEPKSPEVDIDIFLSGNEMGTEEISQGHVSQELSVESIEHEVGNFSVSEATDLEAANIDKTEKKEASKLKHSGKDHQHTKDSEELH